MWILLANRRINTSEEDWQCPLYSVVTTYYQNKPEEDILHCKCLESHITGETAFVNVIDIYTIEHIISWQKCVGVCADRNRTILHKAGEVVARVRTLVSSFLGTTAWSTDE